MLLFLRFEELVLQVQVGKVGGEGVLALLFAFGAVFTICLTTLVNRCAQSTANLPRKLPMKVAAYRETNLLGFSR